MDTLVNQLRAAMKADGLGPQKIGGLLGDAASRIEDLEDHVLRLEDRIATQESDIRALKGQPHRDG